MLTEYLRGNILFMDQVNSWEEAIVAAAAPLKNSGKITDDYISAMIENVKENGPYIVILPEIAMPHARSEKGALATGLSFLHLNQPIEFPKEKSVKIILALCSNSENGHLELLGELASALMEETIVNQLKQATTEEEILQLMKRAEEG